MSNSLAAVHPELIAEWSEKNLPLTPDSITFGSNKKVWWKGACGHEWETSVKARSNGEKCPICSGARVVAGINDLSTLKPELASEWSEENEIKPTEVSIGSHKKVIWKCKLGHEWIATVKSRTIKKTGCPYCSHNKVLAGFNDLATLFPEVADEWSDKNEKKPTEVMAFANSKAWWKCRTCGYEWNTLISTRSYGKWIVREIEQPKGFVLDEKAYEVNISKAEQVVEIEIVNEYVHGNIRLTKVDAEYPDNKLTGATFEVYKDTNENGKIDDGDELIGNLEETETGIYEMKELLYGKYIVRETKAPEGFLLDKGEYSVFIEKDETTYSVENKAGVGFINEAMRGTLKIVKTSSDGKVKGFAFRVTGANGYDMTFETDKNGEIVIEGLRVGEYTVSEVANNASAAYITPADQNVTIKLDETAVVKMHNELRDTPKTGDDTNMKLWYVLAGLSAVGIAVTSVVAHKKKKKEDNE